MGHTPWKPSDNIARQAVDWNPQGKRGRGSPRNIWRGTVLEEAKGVKRTWAEIRTDAKNRVRWGIFVEALCSAAEWWDLSSQRGKALTRKGITGQKNLQEEDRQNLYFECPNQGGCDERGMLHIWGNGNIHKIYGWKPRRENSGVGKNIRQILIERE